MTTTPHLKGWAGALLCAAAFVLAAVPAQAQTATSVPLVLQDFSDCQNGNVTDPSGLNVKPNTTYHFYLKCVRQLGDIATGDEGTGVGVFSIPPNTVGNVFAFDSYPEGAPAGNKMQSMTVRLQ